MAYERLWLKETSVLEGHVPEKKVESKALYNYVWLTL